MRGGSGREADAFRDFARPESALADSGLAQSGAYGTASVADG